jgi:hypothetical protein
MYDGRAKHAEIIATGSRKSSQQRLTRDVMLVRKVPEACSPAEHLGRVHHIAIAQQKGAISSTIILSYIIFRKLQRLHAEG